MKLSDIHAIRKIEIYDNHLNRNLRVAVRRRLSRVRGGEPWAYENILVDVTGKGSSNEWSVTSLLFLEPYGDCMPRGIKDRLLISGLGMCLDPHTWTCFLYEKDKGTLRLYPMTRLTTNDSLREAPPKAIDTFLKALNHKRPYHFEISWWALEDFLEQESGWSALRQGLRVIVRAGREYVASLEER